MLWELADLEQSNSEPETIMVKADQIDAWAFSRDGTKLVVGGTEDSAVWIYDTATAPLLKQFDVRR